jgi:hypothetical protein
VSPPAAAAQPESTKRAPSASPLRAPKQRLLQRAQALVQKGEQSQADLAKEARQLIAHVLELRDEMKKLFWDLGVALSRLKEPATYGALGYASFGELCKKELPFSEATAKELVLVSQHMSRDLAVSLPRKQAVALVRLVAATPEDDTPEQVLSKTLHLPDGSQLQVARSRNSK